MPKWSFNEYHDHQASIKIETALQEEELFIVLDKDNSKINLIIEVDGIHKGSFQLTFDTAQELFNWLKSKGAVS